MPRIRTPRPISYKSQFKGMDDIYQQYRKSFLRGRYKPYQSHGSSGYLKKTEYTSEPQYIENNRGERVFNQKHETNPTQVETVTENVERPQQADQKTELRTETTTETTPQKQQEAEGPPEYQAESGRTDVRRRPDSYDIVEMGW